MMAALDGELSSVEQVELDRMLSTHEDLRKEWERLKTVKEVTGTMTFREPPEEVWDRYWDSIYRRAERGLGWVLLSAGLIVAFAWAGWHVVQAILADAEMPSGVKLAIFAIVLGGAILFLSVVRERWFTRRHDPYREVQR
jgi:ferric-dicitrate binding protein FerR (iron transport regulator)